MLRGGPLRHDNDATMLKLTAAALVASLVVSCAVAFRLGCKNDAECNECVFDSYCLNYPGKQPPFVCHGDFAPRYFPGCSFTA